MLNKKLITAIVVFLLLFNGLHPLYAQKKFLEEEAYKHWPDLGMQSASNDGKYIVYAENQGSNESEFIIATDNSWKDSLGIVNSVAFTGDSHYLIYLKPHNGLVVFDLTHKKAREINNVNSFKLEDNLSNLIAYQLKSDSGDLVVCNLGTNTAKTLAKVRSYDFIGHGSDMLVEKSVTSGKNALWWYNASEGKSNLIRSGKKPRDLTFDKAGRELLFTNSASGKPVLEYYKPGMDSAAVIATGHIQGLPPGSKIERPVNFSDSGNRVFFQVTLSTQQLPTVPGTLSDPAVWSWQDAELFSKSPPGHPITRITAMLDLKNKGRAITLGNDDDGDLGHPRLELAKGGDGDFGLICHHIQSTNPAHREKPAVKYFFSLVSLKTGKLIPINSNTEFIDRTQIGFSPDGKFVVGYDPEEKYYFSYNVSTGNKKNITTSLPFNLSEEDNDYPPTALNVIVIYGIAGWIKDEDAVLVYDKYDIWKLDLNGIKQPMNLTDGYGRRNGVTLRLLNAEPYSYGKICNFSAKSDVRLQAFNYFNKQSGYYKLKLNDNLSLRMLSMGPYVDNVRSKNGDQYIIQRQSPTLFPNLFVSSGLIDFIQLTDLAPQKDYNWYTKELLNWKLPDGNTGEGILYKPTDFDPNKRYPIVFNYYERSTDRLFEYSQPNLSDGNFSIPWFVSHGYLVFQPDIHYELGYTGKSAENVVVSAAKYLSQQPWVNKKKMGLAGMSLGGFETNYIVAHCNLFTAALSASGIADATSLRFETIFGSNEGQINNLENDQMRIGSSIWERPDLYTENSPILRANLVTTPILIMADENDDHVPVSQGKQWFIALRSCGKPAWLLQYKSEGHALVVEKDQLDFSIKIAQFFDHYLKDAPMPEWMAQHN